MMKPYFKLWFFLFIVLSTSNNVESYLGISWGRMSYQRMIPSMVVDMLLQNGIHHVKLFSSSKNVLQAFAGTDISITITIPNDDLKNFTNIQVLRTFLKRRILSDAPDANIRYICVGTQPLSISSKPYFHAVDVLQNVQTILKEPEFTNRSIKATMSHFTDILVKVDRPSEGEFIPEVKEHVVRTCQLLYNDSSPVWLDIFPIHSSSILFNDMEFAFMENNSTSKFHDKANYYTNIFDVMFDTFVSALNKNGLPDMKIVAGQVGWPTDGMVGANNRNAERFHQGFIKHVLRGTGTPLYPWPIDAYIHNLADESKLSIARGGYMRHWGIYQADGKPKYSIDFSGQGRDIKPVTAKGITHMPKRWCIFNNSTQDWARIHKQIEVACNSSDCTSLTNGGSCSHLESPHNVSYVFNMYFQSKSQKVSDKACNFDGLGAIVPDDPSLGSCLFPVGILAAEDFGGNGIIRKSNAARFTSFRSQNTMYYIFLLIFLIL